MHLQATIQVLNEKIELFCICANSGKKLDKILQNYKFLKLRFNFHQTVAMIILLLTFQKKAK